MKKHVWEYFFKDEEELEKQWWYFSSRDVERNFLGCISILFIFILFFITLITSLHLFGFI